MRGLQRCSRIAGALTVAAIVTPLVAQDAAPTDPLVAVLREFDDKDKTKQQPWDRLLAALQESQGVFSPAALAELQKFVRNGREMPHRSSDAASVRAVWALVAKTTRLVDYSHYGPLNGAELEYREGNEAEAVRLWEETYKRAKWLRFDAMTRLYYACQDWRDCVLAQKALDRASACAANDDAVRVRLDVMQCNCSLRMGLFADAHEALRRATTRASHTKLDSADLESLTVAELDLDLEAGDFREAERVAREALRGDLSAETRYRMEFGLAMALGRCGTAEERDGALRQLESMLTTVEPVNRLFVMHELAELCVLTGHTDRARELAQLLRANRSWDQMTAPQRVAAIAGELAGGIDRVAPARRTEFANVLDAIWSRLETEWRAMPQFGRGVAFLQQKFRRNVLGLSFRLEQASGNRDWAHESFRSYLEADSLGSAARRSDLSAPSVEQVQALLGVDDVLLAYLPAEVGSHVFVVTRDDVALESLPSSLQLELDAGTLRRELQATNGAPSAELRRRLDAVAAIVLPASVQARLQRASVVTIVGRELCGGIPFECLPWADAEAPWFGLAKAIAYLPSLTIGSALGRRSDVHESDGHVRFLVGSSIAAGDVDNWHVEPLRLPDGWQHAAAGAVGVDGCELHQPATRRSMLNAGPTAAFAGILAHGILDGTRERQNGILLGADDDNASGAVWPEDIEAAAPPGRIVFLGVCGAAAGALKRGEDGSHHLGGALLHAGAAGVILSDHSVFLDTSLATLEAMIRAMVDGKTAATALLVARRELWQRGEDLATLAAFRYEGLPEAKVTLQPERRDWFTIAALAGIAAVVLGLLAWRRTRRAR